MKKGNRIEALARELATHGILEVSEAPIVQKASAGVSR